MIFFSFFRAMKTEAKKNSNGSNPKKRLMKQYCFEDYFSSCSNELFSPRQVMSKREISPPNSRVVFR